MTKEQKEKYSQNKNLCDMYNPNLDSQIFTEEADTGYLTGRAVVTTIGVFPYLLEDGTVFNELRLPEEVFNTESLRSLQMKPITLEHPAGLVTADNMQELSVGTTGEDVSRAEFWGGEIDYGYKTDGTQISIPMRITERKAIDAVKNGKRALSCGYTRDLELTEGTWCGMHYDGIQRNIRYNHVAICDRGRAGDTAVIRMDNAFVPTYFEKGQELKDDNSIPNRRKNNMKKLTIDSVSYELDDKVVEHITAVEKERDTVQANLDAANLRIDSMQTEMASMIKAEDLNAKVKELQAVKDTADKFGVALDENASVLDSKKAVIKVAMPTINIEGKSDDYVNALFDSASLFVKPEKKQEKKNDSADPQDEQKGEDQHQGEQKNDSVDVNFDSVSERLMKKFTR